jgi:hypothetical protein
VFGLATPTNARGGWALDVGLMGRLGADQTAAMMRAMLSYGITQDLQVSFSAPFVFQSLPLAPARTTSMMPGSADFEGIVAWRFHRQAADVGQRFESTAYGGLIVPGPQRPAGLTGSLQRAPGAWGAAATGLASRSHYLWAGAGFLRFSESDGDRRPGLFFYSGVWGFRPRPWRKDYPDWDWRFFIEMTGEKSDELQRRGIRMPGTGGHQVFLGPTALGIYKNYAIEGGILFPLYRQTGRLLEEERFRFAVNFSYFF